MAAEQTRVLVTGATGNRGGAVVDHLLDSDAEFDVRGLTRDADGDGDAARALADRGVTVVEGDLNDEESLRPHVADADAVFAVTTFWTQGYDRQVQQGKNLANVAADEGVDRFVFSGSAATSATPASPTSTRRGKSNSTLRSSTCR